MKDKILHECKNVRELSQLFDKCNIVLEGVNNIWGERKNEMKKYFDYFCLIDIAIK